MQRFVDEITIEIASGNGGPGAISFRREKYIPRGGPDGGDGGKGGDVIFRIRENLKTLTHLRPHKCYRAADGAAGKGKRMHGKNGEDLYIDLPPGSLIRDYETGELLKDLDEEGWLALEGGKGGKGNWHYRSSVRQAPRKRGPHEEGKQLKIGIELRLIADAGLVGFPNAGKSSLLKALTNADPEVASYAFTTKVPNLGVLRRYGEDLVLADIPGLIKGASQGAGLGYRFLKHISRNPFLIFMIDLSSPDFLESFPILLAELNAYQPDLGERKRLVLGTKKDLDPDGENYLQLQKSLSDEELLAISIYDTESLKSLADRLFEELKNHEPG